MDPEGSLWSDFSYVVSSHHRERVFSSLKERPKLPRDVAAETRLRLSHVSRSLGELSRKDLVVCLTPELRARGRLYSLTEHGRSVLRRMLTPDQFTAPASRGAGGVPTFVPRVRASSVLRILTYLRQSSDPSRFAGLLQAWGVPVSTLTEDTWLPVSDCARLLDLMEERFGDGTYGYVRRAFSDAAVHFPTIREQLSRGLPLSLLARTAPSVYAKEWNYGRLEVEVGPKRSVMRHFDWAPTPAMCAMFHGIYEGILLSRRVAGGVVKTRCVRANDPCCEYIARW